MIGKALRNPAYPITLASIVIGAALHVAAFTSADRLISSLGGRISGNADLTRFEFVVELNSDLAVAYLVLFCSLTTALGLLSRRRIVPWRRAVLLLIVFAAATAPFGILTTRAETRLRSLDISDAGVDVRARFEQLLDDWDSTPFD